MTDLTVPDASHSPTCFTFDERLLAYLEQELTANDRLWMEQHRATCARCDAIVRDLDAIATQAAALPPLTPTRDLWSGIEARLDTPIVALHAHAPHAHALHAHALHAHPTPLAARPRAIRSVGLRTFAIAATVLVAVTSTITWRVAQSRQRSAADSSLTQTVAANTPDGTHTNDTGAFPLAQSGSVLPVANIDVVYEQEISALRTIVTARFSELDSTTVSELQRNLAIIDKAIDDSRKALAKDPNSRVLSTTLDRALETKLSLMRRVALL